MPINYTLQKIIDSLQWRSDTSCVRCVRTPVSKIHNILVYDFSELCMYDDLRVKPTGMFVK